MGFHGNFMGFHGDFLRFHGDFIGFLGPPGRGSIILQLIFPFYILIFPFDGKINYRTGPGKH